LRRLTINHLPLTTNLFHKSITHLKYRIFISLLLISGLAISAEPKDSVVSRQSLFVIPHASYQQETSWAPGIAYGYYFKSKDISRISSISGSAVYTFKEQFMLNITPKIFFNSNKWYLYTNLNLKNYPDFYYGIGNRSTNLRQAFTSQNFSVLLQPQYIVSKNIFLGVSFSVRAERLITDSVFQNNQQAIFDQFGSIGWTPFIQLNAGLMAAYDSRDNQFYPQCGVFAKTTLSLSNARWGSSYTLNEVTIDVRQYIPLFENHVFAWQVFGSSVFGENGLIPFQLLPTLGGRDAMRGFRQGQYRDNVLFLAQTEYRLPIYKRLKAAVFCSMGDVMNSTNYCVDKLKVSYGAGLRYRLNDARVHLRLDLARNNYGEALQFYITATEAF